MKNNIKSHPLIQELISLDLPVKDFVVIGSGPLLAHGIKNEIHDLDIIARGEAWEKAKHYHKLSKSNFGDPEVSIFLGDIEIFRVWEPGVWDEDKMINEAELIEGIPFAKLEYVLEYKKRMKREKDIEDIKLLESYFSEI